MLQRQKVYWDKTAPLKEYYEERGVLKTFKGETSDVIFSDVKKFVDKML